MPNCIAKGCNNRSSGKAAHQLRLEKNTRITFHRFPKEESRRLQWAEQIGSQLTTLPKHAYVCSMHFTPDSFDRHSQSCVRLKDDALPSLNVPEDIKLNDDYLSPQNSDISNLPLTDVTSVLQDPETSANVSTQTTFVADLCSTPKATCSKLTPMSPERTQDTPRKVLLRKAMQHQQEVSRRTIQSLKKQNLRQRKRILIILKLGCST